MVGVSGIWQSGTESLYYRNKRVNGTGPSPHPILFLPRLEIFEVERTQKSYEPEDSLFRVQWGNSTYEFIVAVTVCIKSCIHAQATQNLSIEKRGGQEVPALRNSW